MKLYAKNAARKILGVVCVSESCLRTHGDARVCSHRTRTLRHPSRRPPRRFPNDQLDSLVAPIALYPDPLLAQTLAASTYPLEIVQLQQWLEKNPTLKDKALADAVAKQPWDPSVQAMAGLPDVVKRLADDIQWTTDLGNAFLAQQSDVMDAVQRMRMKAKDTGNLKSNEQIKVETKTVENKTVIVVEQANPQVVYVPSYNPMVVYGAPIYPYPPIYYPPPGYYAAGMAISFGVGVAMGAMWGGGWGYGCGWGGGNNIYINHNNNFNRNTNINGGNRTNVGLVTAGATTGSTIRSIAAALLMRTAGLQTGSEERREEIPLRTGNPTHSNRWAGRSGNLPSSQRPGASDRSAGAELERSWSWAGVSDRSAGADRGGAGAAGASDRSARTAAVLEAAVRIGSAAGTCLAAPAQAAAVRWAAALAVIADRARAPAAAGDPRAWEADRAAGEAEAEAAVDGGKRT